MNSFHSPQFTTYLGDLFGTMDWRHFYQVATKFGGYVLHWYVRGVSAHELRPSSGGAYCTASMSARELRLGEGFQCAALGI